MGCKSRLWSGLRASCREPSPNRLAPHTVLIACYFYSAPQPVTKGMLPYCCGGGRAIDGGFSRRLWSWSHGRTHHSTHSYRKKTAVITLTVRQARHLLDFSSYWHTAWNQKPSQTGICMRQRLYRPINQSYYYIWKQHWRAHTAEVYLLCCLNPETKFPSELCGLACVWQVWRRV